VDGYEPMAPFELDVPEGTWVERRVDLVRKR
jgi:hypothetical protein